MKKEEKKHAAADPYVDLAPTVTLLSRIVTRELCDEVFHEARTRERQRRFSLHTLFFFWAAVTLRAPRSLTLAFEQAGLALDPMVPEIKGKLGSFFARCQSLEPDFFSLLYHRLVDALEKVDRAPYAAGMASLRQRFRTVAIIDGSRLDKIAHRLKILHRVRAVVLPGCITAVYDLFRGYATGLLYWKDAARAELPRAYELADALEENTLLLGDRLYCSIELFARLTAAGSFGLFRYTKTIRCRLVRRLSKAKHTGGLLVDEVVEVGAGENRQQLRRVTLKQGRHTYRALTNVLDAKRLSAEEIATLYPLRWQVERLFYSLKVVLNLKEFYASDPNTVAMQVYTAAAVHATFRVAQGSAAMKLALAPEEISSEKLFPRLAICAYAYALREVLHEEYQAQVSGWKLRKPRLSKFGFMRLRLSNVRLQKRNPHRKKKKFCKSRAQWTSLRKIPGASKLLN